MTNPTEKLMLTVFFVFLQNFSFASDKWYRYDYALLLFCSFLISVQHYFPPGNIPDERLRHLPRHLLLKDYYIFTSLFFFFLWTLFRLQCKLEREQRGLKVWQDKVKSVMRIAELLFTFIPPPPPFLTAPSLPILAAIERISENDRRGK